MIRIVSMLLAVIFAMQASAQSFSCRIGTRPACLDYGDTICSSMGKCVNRNAICFDSFQCNYEGFTCRSNVTACADELDDLLRQHNTLVDDYNNLQRRHNTLVREYNDLLDEADRMRSNFDDLERCVQWAATIEDAQYCF